MPPARDMMPVAPLRTIGKPVPAAQALPVVTGNYDACQTAIGRLTDLQEWVRGQRAATK